MVRADNYRRYAAECLRRARRTTDVVEREVLLRMAETWHRLAERAENSTKSDRAARGG